MLFNLVSATPLKTSLQAPGLSRVLLQFSGSSPRATSVASWPASCASRSVLLNRGPCVSAHDFGGCIPSQGHRAMLTVHGARARQVRRCEPDSARMLSGRPSAALPRAPIRASPPRGDDGTRALLTAAAPDGSGEATTPASPSPSQNAQTDALTQVLEQLTADA